MKTLHIAITFAVLGCLALPRGAAAEGWSLGNWFGGKKAKAELTRTSAGAGTKTTWWGGSKKSSSSDKNNDFFALVQGNKSAKTTTRSKTFLGSQGTRSKSKPADDKPSFWSSLFSKEEPKPPQTVKEWMQQPRLEP